MSLKTIVRNGPTEIDEGSILRALRASNVPVFALSNFGIETFTIAQPVYPFLKEFDRPYISGHMGEVKPGSRIYEMVEEDCGLDPATLLFTDDKQENLDVAAGRGWQTHLFTGSDGLATRLVAEGLLTESVAK